MCTLLLHNFPASIYLRTLSLSLVLIHYKEVRNRKNEISIISVGKEKRGAKQRKWSSTNTQRLLPWGTALNKNPSDSPRCINKLKSCSSTQTVPEKSQSTEGGEQGSGSSGSLLPGCGTEAAHPGPTNVQQRRSRKAADSTRHQPLTSTIPSNAMTRNGDKESFDSGFDSVAAMQSSAT